MSKEKEQTSWRGASLLLRFLGVWMISVGLMAAAMVWCCGRQQFRVLGTVLGEVMERQPDTGQTILKALKEDSTLQSDGNILSDYGYTPSDFFHLERTGAVLAGGLGAGGLLALFLGTRYQNRRIAKRVRELTDYLERADRGDGGVLCQAGEDEFSLLEDEIYKTVTMLRQTRDRALEAREHYAANLANIAHQLKTPITAMSLSLQMADEPFGKECKTGMRLHRQLERQLSRLTRLEEALLVLARIDGGTLTLERRQVDIFTLLTLSADSLEELFDRAKVRAVICEGEEAVMEGDMEWTMEAVMNLLKNCMEHTPREGEIRCTYGSNDLYVWIKIQDQGPGFAREDLPHVFERFYRGREEKGEGIGIGLALAKELIEMENGTLRAFNTPEGGACFEVRFYHNIRLKDREDRQVFPVT